MQENRAGEITETGKENRKKAKKNARKCTYLFAKLMFNEEFR